MSSQKDTILIVDDDLTNLEILFVYLRNTNFTVLVAEDGQSAVERAAITLPDIILLDVMMPEMDGFETCCRLKANEATRNIPVIFMTALSDTRDEVQGFEIGAVDYITKPICIETVVVRINTHLTIRKLQKALEKKNAQLQSALDNIKTLSGLIPICAHCKKIRGDEGYWQQVEVFISQHSEADFSHGICPDCKHELYPDFYKKAG